MSKKSKAKKTKKTDKLARLKYDAVAHSSRRSGYVISSKPADRELTVEERQAILSRCREIQGNFTIAGFALDKHIQYMASYKFQCKTKNKEFNANVERLFNRWKRRENCDITGEFCFDEIVEMVEMHRTTDGDHLVVRHGDLKLQLVEGDRVRNPDNVGIDQDWLHGIHTDEYGRAIEYAISKRQQMGGFKHERCIPAENAWLIGYRRRCDQRRGVTPLAPAINQMSSLYESFDFALAKERLVQMLGLVSKREEPDDNLTQAQADKDDADFLAEIEECFGPEIAHIALHKNDELSVVESENPSSNTQAFWEMMIRLVLLSLHIPYSFFDGSKTNFYGAEGEFNQYTDICKTRQKPMLVWLHELIAWLVEAWIDDGKLELPNDMTLEEAVDGLIWKNSGMPVWVLIRWCKDFLPAISCGAITPQDIASMFGFDYEENAVGIHQAIMFARNLELKMSFDLGKTDNVTVNFGA